MKKYILTGLISTILLSWTCQFIELELKTLFDGKVEILLPKNFGLMPEDMLKAKYPSNNRPTLVYTNEGGSVNLAFNHTSSRASQQVIEQYRNVLASTFKSSYPNAVWEANEVRTINNRKVGVIIVTTQAVDTKIYNQLFFTDVDGRLLIGTFNCTVEEKAAWKESAGKILHSFVVK
ncbi:MAG: hypothetical protein U0V75_04995 [Ferruginibacter sp.]